MRRLASFSIHGTIEVFRPGRFTMRILTFGCNFWDGQRAPESARDGLFWSPRSSEAGRVGMARGKVGCVGGERQPNAARRRSN